MPVGNHKLGALVIADVPSPHQNALFDAIARRGDLNIEVAYCRSRRGDRKSWLDEFPRVASYRVLKQTPSVAGRPLNADLFPLVFKRRDLTPFVVGYYLPAMMASGLALTALRRRWAFWVDSLDPRRASGRPARVSLQARAAQQLFLRAPALCVATGSLGYDSLLRNGVAVHRAASLPFAVDVAAIKASTAETRGGSGELRTSDGMRHLLYVGHLVPLKGLDTLFTAIARVDNVFLTIAGDGDQRSDLEGFAAQLGISNRVQFLGSVPHRELPKLWAAADALTLPSRYDAWGVVVAEAMAAGLPVIGSTMSGAVRDLVSSSCGWTHDPDDVDDLEASLSAFAATPSDRLASMSSAARDAVHTCEPDRVADRFVELVHRVTSA